MKNKSKIIKSGNFEYVMTAFSYCIWICFKKISGPVRYRIDCVFLPILYFFYLVIIKLNIKGIGNR